MAKAMTPSMTAPAAIDQASSANKGYRRISGPRLNHVGDRRADHADKGQADASGDLAAVRGMFAKLMEEQQHNAR